ncbi:hypothetical protein ACH5RR_033882 [Cinchona calisaya]|uniref:Uncharacterized protein n=1 Tax=Cinchona calisaya TaxID=153742 RepID=A0ABD2YBH7_9GENT
MPSSTATATATAELETLTPKSNDERGSSASDLQDSSYHHLNTTWAPVVLLMMIVRGGDGGEKGNDSGFGVEEKKFCAVLI